ncbi:unnamed protein product [Owenia fusiformis]|uniref:C-type lectin domain-containing protein n=1 Tax=Owenia fusiformis TaxID=6347 RepID=A0A8S4N1A9_OWEFU|nr:unnamed protein product [Owenia fusiformis]
MSAMTTLCVLIVITLIQSVWRVEAGKCSSLQAKLKKAQVELGKLRKIAAQCPQRPLSCPDGFVWNVRLNTCHKFIYKIKVSWFDALTYCQSLGANLIAIENENEQTYVIEQIQAAKTSGKHTNERSDFWTGGNDLCDDWKWSGGPSWIPKPLNNFTKWDVLFGSRPQPEVNEEKCMFIHGTRDYKWHDGGCQESRFFICEINLP